ncbi:MAG: amino acid permease, partial [Bryobacteraceae bacterium]|nr:amino acid permease [Bryobacteraceae bacterium]
DIERPFRIWLYPIPSVIALLGWVYIFATSGVTFILYGFATVAAGLIAYAIWSRQTTGRQAI